MMEIGGDTAHDKWLDPLASTRKLANMVLGQSVELFCMSEVTVGSEEPPNITMLLLSPEESEDLHSRINSRLKLDLRVMYNLSLYGVQTPLNESSALEDHANLVRFSHYKNHPRSRSAFRSKEAIDLAVGAFLEAPAYRTPDRSPPTLEEIFPTG